MNSFIDPDKETTSEERELTLGSGTILAIFVALVLVCGCFFGLGYKIGSHQPAPPTQASSVAASTPTSNANFTSFKPAAGSPLGAVTSASGGPKAAAAEKNATAALEAEEKHAGAASAVPTVRDEPFTHPKPGPSDADADPAGTYFVQVAAVSHQEDAQLLIHALKAKGYPVGAHLGTQDKFYHVQVGPFGTMKDAVAAKQKLSADGYQPIIK